MELVEKFSTQIFECRQPFLLMLKIGPMLIFFLHFWYYLTVFSSKNKMASVTFSKIIIVIKILLLVLCNLPNLQRGVEKKRTEFLCRACVISTQNWFISLDAWVLNWVLILFCGIFLRVFSISREE